jgi:hypothetical protein
MKEQYEVEINTSFSPHSPWVIINLYNHTHPYKQFYWEILGVEVNPLQKSNSLEASTDILLI